MQKTLKNRTVFCRDNLEILRGINSESIDLIYLDPPFNKNKIFNAPIGGSSEEASFDDTWGKEDIKDEWIGMIADKQPILNEYLKGIARTGNKSNRYYVVFMAIRLMEMHRILKPTGSLYYHCDSTMSHYIKILMDCIIGHGNFRNEIIWHYSNLSAIKRYFPRKHDIIFFYVKGKSYTFNGDEVRIPYSASSTNRVQYKGSGFAKHAKGSWINKKGKIPDSVWDIPLLKGRERVGYPTQKPLKLLERIIQASSTEGDMVLDPFCGCATTCIAAEKLGRQWVGIDISRKAYELVLKRLKKEVADPENLTKYQNKVIEREDIPQRTDIKDESIEVTTKRDLKYVLYGRQKEVCNGCQSPFAPKSLEVDHIIPDSGGGGDNVKNLQLLCSHCNRIKGDRPMEYLLKEVKGERERNLSRVTDLTGMA